ncbi:hypothetical protein BGX26_006740, partial [Mortierella sp. AD094]
MKDGEDVRDKLRMLHNTSGWIKEELDQTYIDEATENHKKWKEETDVLEDEYLLIYAKERKDDTTEDLLTELWAMLGERETENQKDKIKADMTELKERKAERKREKAEWLRKKQGLKVKQIEKEEAEDVKYYAEIKIYNVEREKAKAKVEKAKTEPRKYRPARLEAEKRILDQQSTKKR